MKIIWLDREGYVEKTEVMTAKQAGIKVRPFLDLGGVQTGNALAGSRNGKYCASVDLKAGTLTVYKRGGSWCIENRQECRGNGCASA